MARFHKVGWQRLSLSRVPSWDWPGVRRRYGRVGAWEHERGLSLRWRDYVLHINLRGRS